MQLPNSQMTNTTDVNSNSVKLQTCVKFSVGDAFECEVDNEIIIFNAASDASEKLNF